MSIARFILDFLVYDDSTATNDPQQRLFDYKKQLDLTNLATPNVQALSLPGATVTTITVPPNAKYLFIETDQTIKVRLNGEADDNNDVSPTVAGTSNGMFFKRGVFTSLSINVPGATAANVKIFMGS